MKLFYSILIFIGIVLFIIFTPYNLVVLLSKFIIIKQGSIFGCWLLGVALLVAATIVIGASMLSIHLIHNSLKSKEK